MKYSKKRNKLSKLSKKRNKRGGALTIGGELCTKTLNENPWESNNKPRMCICPNYLIDKSANSNNQFSHPDNPCLPVENNITHISNKTWTKFKKAKKIYKFNEAHKLWNELAVKKKTQHMKVLSGRKPKYTILRTIFDPKKGIYKYLNL